MLLDVAQPVVGENGAVKEISSSGCEVARLVSGTQRIPDGTEMVSLIGLLICRRLELWISTSSLVFEARHFSEAQTDYGERCCAVSFCYWQSWLDGGT